MTRQNVFVEDALGIEQVSREVQAAGGSFAVLVDRSDHLGSSGTCKSLPILDDRLQCLEDPVNWNQGPEFPFWGTSDSISLVQGISISTLQFDPGASPNGIPCIVRSEAQLADSPPISAVLDRSADQPNIDRADGIELCKSIPGSVIGYPSWVTNQDIGNIDIDGLYLSDGDPFFEQEETSAVQKAIRYFASGEQLILMGGSFAQVTAESTRRGNWSRIGELKTSVWVANDDLLNLVQSLESGRTVVHGQNAFIEARVYDETGLYLDDRSTTGLGTSSGARVESSGRERYIRVKGRASLNSSGWLYEYSRAETGPILENVYQLEPVCTDECLIDFTLLHEQSDPRVFVATVAPVNIVRNNNKQIFWEDFAIASPIYFD